jgi:cytochrome c-type biogenesis protein
VPFLLAAVGFNPAQRGLSWFRRHHLAVQVAAGLLLIAMGALVGSGELFRLNIAIRNGLDALELDFLNFLWRI